MDVWDHRQQGFVLWEYLTKSAVECNLFLVAAAPTLTYV